MTPEALTNEVVRRMVALLKDPQFCTLRTLADEHPLPWAEFCRMRMPAGITQEQTWDILNTLRRQTAIELPFRDGDGRCGWFYPTRSILSDLDDIDRRCHEKSWLDLAIKSRNTTYFLIEEHVDDAITSIREDGLDVGYEKARSVLLGERDPETETETLLLNGHRALWDLDEYVEKPCTPEVILELFERVSQGVGDQTTPPLSHSSQVWKRKDLDTAAALSLAARLVEQHGVGRTEHPLLLALGIRHLIMSVLPLPAWNGIVSSLLMKLLFLKSNLPVLAFVPIIKACQEWESGVLRPPAVMATVGDSGMVVDDEVDYTVYMGVVTQLVRRRVDGVEEELRRVIERDEAFLRTVREDIEINHRQRTVLQIALSNPESVFKIESHQKTHRVAYATARADLMKLADLGFLQCIRTKRAFAYSVPPNLRQLLKGSARKAQD